MTTYAKWLCCALSATLTISAPAPAAGESYPAKPITLVVPFPAAGAADILARAISAKLRAVFDQPVVVDIRTGANGMVGAQHVATAQPDGYTLLLSSASEVAINPVIYRKMAYDPVTDLEPITLVATTPSILVVHSSLPAKSARELIELIRAKPNQLSYGSVGAGSPQHFVGEYMKLTLKIDMTHIPYRGAPPALVDLIGGHLPIGIIGLLPAMSSVKAGKVRALAVTSLTRASALPDIPSLSESILPGFESTQWFALWAPAKTPKEIVDKLNKAIVPIIRSPDFARRMIELGSERVGSSAEYLRKFQHAEMEKYRQIADAIHMKLN